MKIRKEQDIQNIDKNLDVNLLNLIEYTKNLLLKINENVTLKEEFETFQFMNYYNKKYIQEKTNTFCCFQSSKRWKTEEKIIWSGQNWNK